MGKSAKLHKRVKKTKGSTKPTPEAGSSAQLQAQTAKKKTALKMKAPNKSKSQGPILGGADYVALMMGGRRKAKEEAAKLPPPDIDMSW